MLSPISVKPHVSCVVSFAVLGLLLIPAANGFQFYLHSGERRCFTESAPPNTKVLGEYTVSTGEGHMAVDISIRVPEDNLSLLHKRNIDHGKFAFVVPFLDAAAKWRILAAEMHRKKTFHKIGEVYRKKPAGDKTGETRRKLLSAREADHRDRIHHENVHERHFDQHGRAKPPSSRGEGHESDLHNSGYRRAQHAAYHPDHEDSKAYEHHHHHQDHDIDIDDDIDDFDLDDYDGIDDDDLDQDLTKMSQAMGKGTHDDVSASAKHDEPFDSRGFEICLSSDGVKDAHKRRVRLVIHKGETAHDYTRLAKREHMTQLEVSLRRVSEELHELMRELDKVRQKESSLQRINENTNGRVVILAMVSLISLAAAGSYQVMYTQRFLKRKKIL